MQSAVFLHCTEKSKCLIKNTQKTLFATDYKHFYVSYQNTFTRFCEDNKHFFEKKKHIKISKTLQNGFEKHEKQHNMGSKNTYSVWRF